MWPAVDKEFAYLVPAALAPIIADRDPGAGRPGRPAGGRLGGRPRRRSRPGPAACVRSRRSGAGVRSRSWSSWPAGPPGGGPAGGGRCWPRPRPSGPCRSCRRPPGSRRLRPPPTGLTAALPVGRPVTLRLPPSADATPLVAELAQRGPTLVVVPSLRRGAVLAERLRRAGGDVAVMPADWAHARAGAARGRRGPGRGLGALSRAGRGGGHRRARPASDGEASADVERGRPSRPSEPGGPASRASSSAPAPPWSCWPRRRSA